MSMKFERDERKFDFHDIGCEIKRKRETSGMTQDQLAFIIDREPRTIIYNENDGQHPSLNTFYQMVTMFDISVDQFFYPDMSADDACKKRINTLAALTLDRFGYNRNTSTYENWGMSSSLVNQAWEVSPENVTVSYTTGSDTESFNIDHRP